MFFQIWIDLEMVSMRMNEVARGIASDSINSIDGMMSWSVTCKCPHVTSMLGERKVCGGRTELRRTSTYPQASGCGSAFRPMRISGQETTDGK